MLATIVNAAAIIVGTTLGLVLKTRLAERYRTAVFNGIGVASLLIGISMALQTQRVLYLVLAVILGGIVGTALRLHDGVHALGLWLRRGGRCRSTQRQHDPRERTQLAGSVDAYSNDQDKSV